MAVAQHSTQDMLVAGTASGQLMLLDIERQHAGTQMLCTPPGQSQVATQPASTTLPRLIQQAMKATSPYQPHDACMYCDGAAWE